MKLENLEFSGVSFMTEMPLARCKFENGYTVSIINNENGYYNGAIFKPRVGVLMAEEVDAPYGMDIDAEEVQQLINFAEKLPKAEASPC